MFQIKVFTFSPIQENTYLLYNEHKNAIIIDPGCYEDHERAELQSFIHQHQLTPVKLLNTHCHLDHVFGNQFVYEVFDIPLHLHEKEKVVLSMAPTMGLMWNLPFIQYSGPLMPLIPGDVIEIDDDRLEILFAPGHSPGHLCFYCREQGFVIGGDVLFRESIGRTDLPGGDHSQLIESIRKELMILPDETIVYSGHGPSTTIAHERLRNPFLQR